MAVDGGKVGDRAQDWVGRLQRALDRHDAEAAASLIRPDGSWRDILALTGSLRTADGRDGIRALLAEAYSGPRTGRFGVVGEPKVAAVKRWGVDVVEVLFDIRTEAGEGLALVRLTPSPDDPSTLEGWTVLTTLETLDVASPPDPGRSDRSIRHDDTMNWLDVRLAQLEYDDREPAALVIGAGQNGLSIAARLKAIGIDALIVERWPRVGDSWRRRYHSLKLHNETPANHLPFLPFPASWPRYIPKDKLANWFEFYADALELNVWTDTTFAGATFDEGTGQWVATVQRAGVERVLRPRHIIMATGATGGIPRWPHLEGLSEFRGPVLHSSAYTDGEEFGSKRVLVVGAGNSGHDVAQDLYLHHADVTMVQRSSVTVTSLVPACQKYHEPYLSRLPTDEVDLMTLSTTYPMKRRYLQHIGELCRALDKDLLDGLAAAGFKTDYGDDGTGHPFKFLRRGGGYYLDVGCSQLIIDRKVKILPARELVYFTETGVRLTDGSVTDFDAVVLATGYENNQELVRRLFGSAVADRVGPMWGLDEEGELRNVCRRTAQDGLWFLAGSFLDARTLSKYLALQVQAAERGISL